MSIGYNVFSMCDVVVKQFKQQDVFFVPCIL